MSDYDTDILTWSERPAALGPNDLGNLDCAATAGCSAIATVAVLWL
jgi:hypothetical protein